MPEHPISKMPINDLHVEEGSKDLVNSESMKPYMALLLAEMSGKDTSEALAILKAMPLQERYIWRVVSALKWGLCDLDTENVAADLATLSEQDISSASESLGLRAMQFSLFVKALVGEAAAREIMLRALACQSQ